MEILKNTIIKHNTLYRMGIQTISDTEYDRLVEMYESGTGKKLVLLDYYEYGNVIKLPYEMGSLNKLKTIDEVDDWLANCDDDCDVELSLKFDGISVQVGYGHAMTRGNGVDGTMITDAFSHIGFNRSSLTSDGFLRGEAVMTIDNFKKYLEPIGYSHPRNAVAGLMGAKTLKPELLQYVDFIPFHSYDDDYGTPLGKYSITTKKKTLTHKVLSDFFKETSNFYPCDGVVLKLMNVTDDYFGYETGTLNPKHMRAYKHKSFDNVYETVVNEIERTASKSGVYKPVIIFDLVKQEGAELRRLNGDNEMFLKYFGIGIGQTITIRRSGGIISRLVSVGGVEVPDRKDILEDMKTLSVEEFRKKLYFPKDFKDFYVETGYKWDGVNIVVDDIKSNRQVDISRIEHFVKTMKMENFGSSTIAYLYDAYGVKTIADLIEFKFQKIVNDTGYGQKTVDILEISRSEALDNREEHIIRHASCIFPNLGKTKLKLFLTEGIDAKGLGESAKTVINDGFEQWHSFQFFYKLQGFKIKPTVKVELTGNVYCPTNCRLSDDLKKAIENAGDSWLDSYNKKVTHVVVLDMGVTSSKTKKCIKNDGTIILMKDLVNKYIKSSSIESTNNALF